MRAVWVLALAAAAPNLAFGGTGCQKKLAVVCPDWNTGGEDDCLECVKAHLGDLQPECTEKQATRKCSLSPPAPIPMPPPPPSPPVEPHPGAPQPHIIFFVVDDQGWANVGYRNENVITPHMDEFAREGATLDRHYVFRWCAPTRSAFMTGRDPHHVLEKVNYVTRGMTMLPRKLQQVGYVTHQVGKWHLGALEDWMTPHGRGFNSSFGYLSGGEDHYTQLQKDYFGCTGTDLFDTDAPAVGRSGTYGEYLYNDALQLIISKHNKKFPLFVYAALQSMHAPQQVPKAYSDKYKGFSEDFAIMNGMATISDEVFGNLTAALKAKGMWQDTLILISSDNGGPAGQASSGHSGNNFPLRGGKTNNFEGGIRVASAIGGGFLPKAAQGTTLNGYMHASDWYPTFCGLAGIDAADPNPEATEIPGVDGFDLWPYISGEVASSPRSEIMISSEDNGGIINGSYKMIMGVQSYGFWTSPNYPNASTDHSKEKEVDCGDGCLFDIVDDPSEYEDLARKMPEKLAQLKELWQKRSATKYWPAKMAPDTKKCKAYVASHKGFLGPYLSASDDSELIV